MAEYIDRSLLLEEIDAAEKNAGMGSVIAKTLKRYIKRQPAEDVTPVVHSRWLKNERFKQKQRKCSECGFDSDFEYNFCPNCGAKMDLD